MLDCLNNGTTLCPDSTLAPPTLPTSSCTPYACSTACKVRSHYPSGGPIVQDDLLPVHAHPLVHMDASDPRTASIGRWINAAGWDQLPNLRVIHEHGAVVFVADRLIVAGEELSRHYPPDHWRHVGSDIRGDIPEAHNPSNLAEGIRTEYTSAHLEAPPAHVSPERDMKGTLSAQSLSTLDFPAEILRAQNSTCMTDEALEWACAQIAGMTPHNDVKLLRLDDRHWTAAQQSPGMNTVLASGADTQENRLLAFQIFGSVDFLSVQQTDQPHEIAHLAIFHAVAWAMRVTPDTT